MQKASEIVHLVVDQKGWQGKIQEHLPVQMWAAVVGEVIARNTVALRFRGGTLYVRARSPQWTQEMHFHEARIIARLNGVLKKPLVKKIRCSVVPPRGMKADSLKPGWEDPTFPEMAPPARKIAPAINDEAARRAREIASRIQDPEMRAAQEQVIAAGLRASAIRQRVRHEKGGAKGQQRKPGR